MMNDFINFNGTLLRRIPHEPDNGYHFYVSCDGEIGLRVAPDPEYALEIDRDIQRYRNRAKNQPQIS